MKFPRAGTDDAGAALVPSLTLFDATSMSVGAIVGAGIFVVVGISARQAGSALLASMLVAGGMALLSALSMARLTRWLPIEGGSYEVARRLLGAPVGFLAGWMYVVNNTFTGAAVAMGFAYSLRVIVPGLPIAWTGAALCVVFTVLNSIGIRQSARVNNVLVAVKVVILGLFCVLGLAHLEVRHFAPFEPFRWGVVAGASSIVFAFGGAARVAVMAEEVRDARRNVPRAIIISLLVSTAIYLVVGVAAIGLVGAPRLAASDAPLSAAIAAAGHPVAVYAVSAGGLVAMANVLLTSILGISRMAYAMARRGDLPHRLTALGRHHPVPLLAIWASGLTMAVLAAAVDLTKVVTVITNLCALRLGWAARGQSRMFPVLGLATSLGFLVAIFFIAPLAWGIGLAALTTGAMYYGGRRLFVCLRRRP